MPTATPSPTPRFKVGDLINILAGNDVYFVEPGEAPKTRTAVTASARVLEIRGEWIKVRPVRVGNDVWVKMGDVQPAEELTSARGTPVAVRTPTPGGTPVATRTGVAQQGSVPVASGVKLGTPDQRPVDQLAVGKLRAGKAWFDTLCANLMCLPDEWMAAIYGSLDESVGGGGIKAKGKVYSTSGTLWFQVFGLTGTPQRISPQDAKMAAQKPADFDGQPAKADIFLMLPQ